MTLTAFAQPGYPVRVRIRRSDPQRWDGRVMKRLLQGTPTSDPLLSQSLQIINRFDEMIDESASLTELAQAAEEMTGLEIGVCDLTSEEVVGQPHPEASLTALAVAALHRHGVRGRSVELVDLGGVPALVASVELAHGRVGVVWLRGATIGESAYLVAERLAAAAAVTVLRTTAPARSSGQEWIELLTSLLDESEAERLGSELRLGNGVARLVVVSRPRMKCLMSPAALAHVLHRKLAPSGTAVASMVVRGDAAVVCVDDPRLETWLAEAVDDLARVGVAVDVGIGAPGRLHQLRDSWSQAMDALESCGLAQTSVLRARDAGALSLLRRIPTDLIVGNRDVQRVQALSLGDRDLLRAYLVGGSLRVTAARVNLHHTSVRYRLARIHEAVGLDLADPVAQHRLFVACALLSIVENEAHPWDHGSMQRS